MQHATHRTTKMIQTQHKRPSCTSQGPFFACLTVCGHHSHKFWSIYSFRQNVCVGIYILCVDGIIECCVLCVLRWSRQRFFFVLLWIWMNRSKRSVFALQSDRVYHVWWWRWCFNLSHPCIYFAVNPNAFTMPIIQKMNYDWWEEMEAKTKW